MKKIETIQDASQKLLEFEGPTENDLHWVLNEEKNLHLIYLKRLNKVYLAYDITKEMIDVALLGVLSSYFDFLIDGKYQPFLAKNLSTNKTYF